MFDGAVRVQQVSTLYQRIVEEFEELKHNPGLPKTAGEVYGTVGFPSRRARGKPDERLGAEVLLQEVWQGNATEKAIVSLHPEKTQDTEQAAWSILYGILKVTCSPRMARYRYDKHKRISGPKIKAIAQEIGPFPDGHAVIGYKAKDRNRMRLYECACHPPVKIRHAGDHLQATCCYCGSRFELVS